MKVIKANLASLDPFIYKNRENEIASFNNLTLSTAK